MTRLVFSIGFVLLMQKGRRTNSVTTYINSVYTPLSPTKKHMEFEYHPFRFAVSINYNQLNDPRITPQMPP